MFVAWRREELKRIVISHDNETDHARARRRERHLVAHEVASRRARRHRRHRAPPQHPRVRDRATQGERIGGDPRPRSAARARRGADGRDRDQVRARAPTRPGPEGSAYLRVDDGAPIVVAKELATTLLQPSDTYRDRTVVPYLSIDLARLELRHPGGTVLLRRHGQALVPRRRPRRARPPATDSIASGTRSPRCAPRRSRGTPTPIASRALRSSR